MMAVLIRDVNETGSLIAVGDWDGLTLVCDVDIPDRLTSWIVSQLNSGETRGWIAFIRSEIAQDRYYWSYETV